MKNPIPFIFLVALTAIGCSARQQVALPPSIDLTTYERIGMIEFVSNTDGSLKTYTTEKFVEALQQSQDNVRVVELGTEKDVLEATQQKNLDYDAIQAIGKRYGLDAILIGSIDVTNVSPDFDQPSEGTMGVDAFVEASITARLYQANDGATLWSSSARGKETVAHVGVTHGRPLHFGATNPDVAYGGLVLPLVLQMTEDFRTTYVYEDEIPAKVVSH